MDDREIHKSLLNNQFMFRETDIGQPQSTTAATFTKHHLNPNMNLTVLPTPSL
jgi:molybdopterin/thiamine biosynthesis adenylyltransferase